MALYVNHDLRCVNGQTIYLPKWKGGEDNVDRNLTIPDVYVLDTVQKYPVGTKFVDGDRVFHYGYCSTEESAAATHAGIGMLNIANAKSTTTDNVVEPIAETEIVIEDTTSTVNQWAGGYMMSRSHPTITYRILSNTATSGGHVTLTLERGLITATTSGMTVQLNQNPYSKLCGSWSAGRHECSVMGISMVIAVADRWMWVQTWGPANIAGGDEVPGSGNGLRMGQFGIDGTLIWNGWANAASGKQLAGYVINQTSSDSGVNYTASWFVYLMIAC